MISSNRPRIFGADVPFLEWLRERSGIESRTDGVVVTDTDIIIHQWASGVIDAQGKREGLTRDIQAVMGIEVKTRNGLPTDSQRDTLWKWCLTIKKQVKYEGWIIRNFGWSFLQLSGLSPEDSQVINWGRFKIEGEILWTEIDLGLLVQLLSFQRHPDNFDKRVFRRHHKTQSLWKMETTPLGLTIPILEMRRS